VNAFPTEWREWKSRKDMPKCGVERRGDVILTIEFFIYLVEQIGAFENCEGYGRQ
jgi:hypothetical protein